MFFFIFSLWPILNQFLMIKFCLLLFLRILAYNLGMSFSLDMVLDEALLLERRPVCCLHHSLPCLELLLQLLDDAI